MQKAARTILIITVAAVIFFGQQWYSYVTNKTTPYDEFGMQLNSAMPAPIRKWGCDKLLKTFPNAQPPDGCQSEDGKSWM
jgi:hypothetical protein